MSNKIYCICFPDQFEGVRTSLAGFRPEVEQVWQKQLSLKIIREIINGDGDLVVLYLNEEFLSSDLELKLQELIAYNIAIVVIIGDDNFDLALNCGALGVKKVVPVKKITELGKIIDDITCEQGLQVTLQDIGIIASNYPGKIRKALLMIENSYISLMGTSEIAQVLRCSGSSLSQLFKKHNLVSPKKMLMFFKVHHALNLIKESREDLKLKDISRLSGFSCDKGLIECFHRTLHAGPGTFRNRAASNFQHLTKFLNGILVAENEQDEVLS